MNRPRVSRPEPFGGSGVEAVTDLAVGTEHRRPTEGLAGPDEGPQPRHHLVPAARQPKLKRYLVIRQRRRAAELPAARGAARDALDNVLADVREALGLDNPCTLMYPPTIPGTEGGEPEFRVPGTPPSTTLLRHPGDKRRRHRGAVPAGPW